MWENNLRKEGNHSVALSIVELIGKQNLNEERGEEVGNT